MIVIVRACGYACPWLWLCVSVTVIVRVWGCACVSVVVCARLWLCVCVCDCACGSVVVRVCACACRRIVLFEHCSGLFYCPIACQTFVTFGVGCWVLGVRLSWAHVFLASLVSLLAVTFVVDTFSLVANLSPPLRTITTTTVLRFDVLTPGGVTSWGVEVGSACACVCLHAQVVRAAFWFLFSRRICVAFGFLFNFWIFFGGRVAGSFLLQLS